MEASLAAAREAGVDSIINIGLGEDNEAVLATAAAVEGVWATVGWHPHEKRPPSDDELQAMAGMAGDGRVVAIGEIGLDYYWRPGYHEVPPEVQQEAFRRMLRLARQLRLPVVVHNRDADNDVLRLLREVPEVGGTLHAFSSGVDFALECVTAGFCISIGGAMTYPRSDAIRAAAAAVPQDRLLLETDAPFLPPQPWRGKPNRPALMVETARRLAELRGVTLRQLAAETSENASRLFGLTGETGP
jgi:TatD DNase family protein